MSGSATAPDHELGQGDVTRLQAQIQRGQA